MLPLRSALRSRTSLLLRSNAPFLATSSIARTLRTTPLVARGDKKWVNQQPLEAARPGDKKLKGDEVITKGGTTLDDHTVPANDDQVADIMSDDQSVAVDADLLAIDPEDMPSERNPPWAEDDAFDVYADLAKANGLEPDSHAESSMPPSEYVEDSMASFEEDVHSAQKSSSSSSSSASTSAQPAPSISSSSRGEDSASSNTSNGNSSSGNNAASSSGGSGNNNDGNGNSGSGNGDAPPPPPKTGKEVAKLSIPDEYPQVLALPITRRPLFPGESRRAVFSLTVEVADGLRP